MVTSVSGGSSGSGSRDVILNLKLASDPKNAAELGKLLKDIKEAEAKFRDLGPKAGATRAQTENYAKMGKAIKEAASEVDKLTQLEVKKAEKIATELKKRIAEEDRARKKDFDDYVRHLNKKEIEQKRASDKAAAAAVKEQEKITKALERESAKRAAIQQKETQSFIAAKQREAAAAQAVASRGSLSNTGGKLLSGGLDLGRGIAISGLIGEQDATKLLDTLLKIESTIATVRGGIDVYQGLAGSVRNYIEAVKAAKVAEEALRAVQLAKAGVPISQIAGAAGAASGGSAAGSAAGGIGGAALGTAGAAVTIVTGLVMSLITLKEQLDGTAAAAEGMTGALMRLFAPLTDMIAGLASSYGFLGGDGTQRAEAAKAASGEKKRMRDMWSDVGDIQSRGNAQIRGAKWAHTIGGIMDDYSQASFGATPDAQRSANRTAQLRNLAMRDQLQAATSFGTSDDRIAAERELKKVNENRIALLKEEYSLVEQTAAKALEGSQQQLRALEEQRKLQQQIAKEAEERYMTGKERFGNMNQSEQQRLIQTQQAFKYADSLDQRGDASSRARAERIRASVSVEDRQKLAGLGLNEGVEFNRRAALENASRNGFNDVFGAQEIKQRGQATQAEAGLNVQIANENQVVVNINATLESQRQALLQELRNEFAIQQAANNVVVNKQMEETARRVVEEQNERIRQNTNQKEAGRGAARG